MHSYSNSTRLHLADTIRGENMLSAERDPAVERDPAEGGIQIRMFFFAYLFFLRVVGRLSAHKQNTS